MWIIQQQDTRLNDGDEWQALLENGRPLLLKNKREAALNLEAVIAKGERWRARRVALKGEDYAGRFPYYRYRMVQVR